MALIECKVCGKQVSDKAKTCPNCGAVLLEEKKTELKTCQECGLELPDGATVCPNCGCPVDEVTENDAPQKVEIAKVSMVDKNKIKKYVGIVIAVVALAVAIFAIFSATKKKQEEQAAKEAIESYASDLDLCVATMYLGAIDAEEAGGLIHDVWSNTIYKKSDSKTNKFTKSSGYWNSDFNTSLSALFSDPDFSSKLSDIRSNQTLVESLMKNLKNPPDEYKDAFDALKELYEVYCDLTGCAVNPTGNLNTYTTTFNNADSDFVKCYKAVKMYQ